MPTILPQLAAYIPRDRVNQLLAAAQPLPLEGVALIADISGFTPLTEALARGLRPDQGAEELTRALDSLFIPLIQEVHNYRGSVIKFGGDALIVWFGRYPRQRTTTVIRRALTAALKMQRVIKRHGRIATPIGPVVLQMKVGLAHGHVHRFSLGLDEFGYEDAIAGATLDRMAAAEHQARPGEIMLDRATYDLLAADLTIQEWRGEFGLVGRLRPLARPQPWPPLIFAEAEAATAYDRLAAYVPAPILERLNAGQRTVGELKNVVSLFVQFHGLDYDRDPHIQPRLQTYFNLAQRIVGRYDGRLNRLITGDKGSLLHVVFGAPLSVEQQEERAVRCALDLRAECGSLSFISGQRIGLTMGRVYAGPVGSPVRHDFTTMGDAINLSARLMQTAVDNQILLDTAVREQLPPGFDLTDLGQIRVKGKSNPIQIFAVQAATTLSRHPRLVQLQPIFGRETALETLRHAWQRLSWQQAEAGSIVTLEGDVGLGKTLLLDTLYHEVEVVQSWQGRWLGGQSLAYGETLSGYLFIDLLRSLLDLPGQATPADTAVSLRQLIDDLFGPAAATRIVPYLAYFMGLPLRPEEESRLAGLTGESVRWHIFTLITDLFERLSQRTPLVVALDDLQWADPTSLQLVQTLLPLTQSNPILLLLAHRPSDAAKIRRLYEQLAPLTGSHFLRLGPLSPASMRQLLDHYAPNLPDHLCQAIAERAGGNPLFLVETTRTLAAQGWLAADTNWSQVQMDVLDLPNSVQGLLLAQLDRLAAEARHTLQLAAVIGKEFLATVLAALRQAERDWEAQLARLTEQEFILPLARQREDAYTFRHVLIQETAYHSLLYERRRAYHRQVAAALEALFPAQVGEQAGLLAHHYERAEAIDTAVLYWQQAADQARLLFASEEAEALYRRVLNLLEQMADSDTAVIRQKAQTYLKLAQNRANQLDFTAAQEYYQAAFALLPQIEAPQDTAVADGYTFRWGVPTEHTHNRDPAKFRSGENSQLLQNLFSGLVELDNEWNVWPALAERWTVADSGTEYHFYLRPDLRWQDGTPLTAADFVRGWRHLLDPATAAPNAYQFHLIQGAEAFHQGEQTDPAEIGVTAVSDHILRVRLIQPSTHFLYLLASPIASPRAAPSTDDYLIGNGAYQWDEEAADELALVGNPHFYRGQNRAVPRVQLVDTGPSCKAYEQERIDWCRQDEGGDQVTGDYIVQDLFSFVLAFACHTPPFAARAARQALAHTLDKRALVNEVWGGVQRPALGGIVPPGIAGHTPELSLSFDPARARQLLTEAGYTAANPCPPLTLAALEGFRTTPDFLQASWAEQLGVTVKVERDVPVTEALGGLKEGRVHIVLLGIGLSYPDPNNILHGLGHSESPFTIPGWQSARFDSLLDEARQTTDYRQQLAAYHEADRLLVQSETVLVPLYYLQAYGRLRPPFTFPHAGKFIRGIGIKFHEIGVK
ncbi:MAG: ABC transporter substrate-binding protein [Chloroflexota bacterium]